MFDCKVCEAKDSELHYLREQNKVLAGLLVELVERASPAPRKIDYSPTNVWDGSDEGKEIFSEFGERIVMPKKLS